MAKILPARLRYPLFFSGLLMMEISGFLLKYAHLSAGYSEITVTLGFLLFVASVLVP
ncbi:MAG: hypothetical protein KGI00_03560 [Candidatus Micrarchaeota archaeon]|nr:hypothetical protein [Candidatus Micrarchaeota archaeon]MDE1824477.1 hypothetical protein [Candidatus Micrarchaeota archaeon]MDE1849780.1 hypothetical protein [Candidatus Micrarchaeota archaeon]